MKTLLDVIKADDDGQLLADGWDSELRQMCMCERERDMRESSHCDYLKVGRSNLGPCTLNVEGSVSRCMNVEDDIKTGFGGWPSVQFSANLGAWKSQTFGVNMGFENFKKHNDLNNNACSRAIIVSVSKHTSSLDAIKQNVSSPLPASLHAPDKASCLPD